MKKSKLFLFGLAALLAAGLLVTGCAQPTAGDPGASGINGPSVVGSGISAEALQSLVDSGAPIILDSTTIGAGYVDLKSAKITVVGTVALNTDSILNAANATFAFGETGKFNTVDGAKWILPATFEVSTWPAGSIATAAIINPSSTIAELNASLDEKGTGFTTGLALGSTGTLTIPINKTLIVGSSGISAGTETVTLAAGSYKATGGAVTLAGASAGVLTIPTGATLTIGSGGAISVVTATESVTLKAGAYTAGGTATTFTAGAAPLAIGGTLTGEPDIEANNLTALPLATVAKLTDADSKVKYSGAIATEAAFAVTGFKGAITFGGGTTASAATTFTAYAGSTIAFGAATPLPAGTTLATDGTSSTTLTLGGATTLGGDVTLAKATLVSSGTIAAKATDGSAIGATGNTIKFPGGFSIPAGNEFTVAATTTVWEVPEAGLKFGSNLTLGEGTYTNTGATTIAISDATPAIGSLTIETTLATADDTTITTTAAGLTAANVGKITGTGDIEFTGDVSYGDITIKVAATFGGKAAFTGNVTQGGDITFSDGVTVTNDKAITADGEQTITLAEGTVLKNTASPALALITAGDDDDLVLTLENTASLTVAAAKLTLADAGLTITSGEAIISNALTVDGVALAVDAGAALKVGGADNYVVLTEATLDNASTTDMAIDGATGTITLTFGGSGDTLALADGGTIETAGSGVVALENTTFGAGTYTASGVVTITAVYAGDTIETEGATNTTDGLTIGTGTNSIALTQNTDDQASTFTFAKSDIAKISIATTALELDQYGQITIEQGDAANGILLGAVSGEDKPGTLTLAVGSKIKGVTTEAKGVSTRAVLTATDLLSDAKAADTSVGTDVTIAVTGAGTITPDSSSNGIKITKETSFRASA